MSDARAAAGPRTALKAAPLRHVGGDGGTAQAVQALGENKGARA
ncbi:hypothetical protein ACGFOU_25805 [Streptomyces sp. NPDC048595]